MVVLGFAGASVASAQDTGYLEVVYMEVPPPVWFGSAALADPDGDGDFDMLLTGSTRPFDDARVFTDLYRNDGMTFIGITDPDGETELVPAIDFVSGFMRDDPIIEVWQSATEWGDFDRDGIVDLAVAGADDNGTPTLNVYNWIVYGSEDRALRRMYSLDGVRAGDVAWGDVDNDGDLDLAACGYGVYGEPQLLVFENEVDDGQGFNARDVGMGVALCSLEWGDYDVDGDLDLLVTGTTVPQEFVTRVYDNDAGTLAESGHDLPGLLFSHAAWGDYDADGDLDILLSGARLSPLLFMEGELQVLRYQSGEFVNVSHLIVGSFENDVTKGRYHGAAGWGDIENGGYLDFFIAGAKSPSSTESIQLYKDNRGTGFTKSSTDRFDGGVFGGGVWADFDQDLDLDLLHWGTTPGEGAEIIMLRNTSLYGKRKPKPPTDFDSEVNGNSVTLQWSGASDRQTPTASLSYNLRIGIESKGVDIVSPMSDPDTGRRHVSRRGNVGHNQRWTVRDLEPGMYWWSVQALDHSLTASEFSEEQTFDID